MRRSAAPAVLLLLCCPATRGETALAYTAHPNMDCNQDDAECEPFHSCRDANGTCVPCCEPATDGEAGCLQKLEAACNSNAVPFGKSAAFECVGFGYAPPGNPGLLKQVRPPCCPHHSPPLPVLLVGLQLAPAVADTQACYNWVKRAPSKTNNETFYFKPGFGPKPPGAPKLFPAMSEHIRVVVSATERLSRTVAFPSHQCFPL